MSWTEDEKVKGFSRHSSKDLGEGVQLAVSRKIPYPEGFKHTESKME